MGHEEQDEYDNHMADVLNEVIMNRLKEINGNENIEEPYDFCSILDIEENQFETLVRKFAGIDVHFEFVLTKHCELFNKIQ